LLDNNEQIIIIPCRKHVQGEIKIIVESSHDSGHLCVLGGPVALLAEIQSLLLTLATNKRRVCDIVAGLAKAAKVLLKYKKISFTLLSGLVLDKDRYLQQPKESEGW
jgi:hypothetical protein